MVGDLSILSVLQSSILNSWATLYRWSALLLDMVVHVMLSSMTSVSLTMKPATYRREARHHHPLLGNLLPLLLSEHIKSNS